VQNVRRTSTSFIDLGQLRPGALLGHLALGKALPLAGRLIRHWGQAGAKKGFDLADQDLTALPMSFPVELEIQLTDGRRLKERCDEARGTCGREFSETVAEVEEKYRREAADRLGVKQARLAIDFLNSVKDHDPARNFFKAFYS